MITRIEAVRYRCFEHLAIDVGPFQVLVGANGSGKSTLLDIPVLLGDLLIQRATVDALFEPQRSRAPRISRLTELVFLERGSKFSFAIEARLPQAVVESLNESRPGSPLDYIRYEVRFKVESEEWLKVESEHLIAFPMSEEYVAKRLPFQGENKQDTGWLRILRRSEEGPTVYTRETGRRSKVEARVAPSLLAMTRVLYESPELYPAGQWFHDLLAKETVAFLPVWNDLRRARPPLPKPKLEASGTSLPWLALNLKKTAPDLFADWVAHVREALPVKSIDVVVREPDHHAYFVVKYRNGMGVWSSGLSDGTLRLLSYTLLAYLPKTPALIMVEEPENGIHPRALETVLQSLSSVYDSQVWVASHSPVVLAHTSLDHVLCARLSPEGAAEIIPGSSHPRLDDWQGGIDLGSLFAAGVLG
jgi:predicted ATPase